MQFPKVLNLSENQTLTLKILFIDFSLEEPGSNYLMICAASNSTHNTVRIGLFDIQILLFLGSSELFQTQIR